MVFTILHQTWWSLGAVPVPVFQYVISLEMTSGNDSFQTKLGAKAVIRKLLDPTRAMTRGEFI